MLCLNCCWYFLLYGGRASYRCETWTDRDLLLGTYRQRLQSLAGQCEPCCISVVRSACTFFPWSLQVQKCDFLKFNTHPLLYTPKSSKGQPGLFRFVFFKEWQSYQSLYEKAHRHVRNSVCHNISLYEKRGVDEKRSRGRKIILYEMIRLS